MNLSVKVGSNPLPPRNMKQNIVTITNSERQLMAANILMKKYFNLGKMEPKFTKVKCFGTTINV